ncbi:MAG: Clp protease N-terminal domain-containing protein, partial [Bacteroidota bacterium]|nr:Clp protease N-terminal domain-containing protein [Bacteroidota bacterium]
MPINLQKLTLKSQEALQRAQEIAAEAGHQTVDPLHLLAALVEDVSGVVVTILHRLEVNVAQLQNKLRYELDRLPKVSGAIDQYLSRELVTLLETARQEATTLKDEYISTEHLLLALAETRSTASQLLREQGVSKETILRVLASVRGIHRVTDPTPEEKYQALQRYGRNLNEEARQGKLDPVIGREDEIRRVMQILTRRTKNNPVLIGEPGVGKTAIVEGLAQRILAGDV